MNDVESKLVRLCGIVSTKSREADDLLGLDTSRGLMKGDGSLPAINSSDAAL